jgi:MIP family channel proteins
MSMEQESGVQRFVAECVGTFALVFAGTGAIVINAESGGSLGTVGIGIVFGLVVMAMIFAVGHASGAHLNPAVTLAFASIREIPWSVVPGYLAAQVIGGLLASLSLRALFGTTANLGATVPAGSNRQSLLLEFILTLLLMFVITAVATDGRAVKDAAAIAIGATVGLEAIFAGPISGASMNPVRSLSPALVSWTWTSQWLYVVGPITGAVVGAVIYRFIRSDASDVVPEH